MYAFLPFCLIGRMLEKIRTKGRFFGISTVGTTKMVFKSIENVLSEFNLVTSQVKSFKARKRGEHFFSETKFTSCPYEFQGKFVKKVVIFRGYRAGKCI